MPLEGLSMRPSSILVIDDEERIRRALRMLLERAGYRVREARGGQDAIRLWREEEGDLVITDIHMPDEDGIETILELRALSPRVPIIAVSGSGDRFLHVTLMDNERQFGHAVVHHTWRARCVRDSRGAPPSARRECLRARTALRSPVPPRHPRAVARHSARGRAAGRP